MSILDDVGDLLTTDLIVAGNTGWALGKGYTPPSPDKIIVIYERGGLPPDETPGDAHSFPEIQIRGRGAEFGYAALRIKMQEVYDSLNNATLAGYVYCYPNQSGPILLQIDKADNRPVLIWDFKTMKEP